jgi:hypothetical protein
MHIFCMIPRNMHFYAVWVCERWKKPPKSDWLEWYQKKQFTQGISTFLISVDR